VYTYLTVANAFIRLWQKFYVKCLLWCWSRTWTRRPSLTLILRTNVRLLKNKLSFSRPFMTRYSSWTTVSLKHHTKDVCALCIALYNQLYDALFLDTRCNTMRYESRLFNVFSWADVSLTKYKSRRNNTTQKKPQRFREVTSLSRVSSLHVQLGRFVKKVTRSELRVTAIQTLII